MSAEGGGLTDAHRARIEAVLNRDGKVMPPEGWAELAEIIASYRTFEHRRKSYPIKAERARWRRLGDAVEKVAIELRQLRETRRANPWPDRALAALREVTHMIETRAAFHAMWSKFSRRENPHRKFLYWGVMRVWTDHLVGGELRYSKNAKNKPGGPLVRFLVACVEPILGDETPGAGLGGIIDRERKDRARTEAAKRRKHMQF
jgi:hypothetical protein